MLAAGVRLLLVLGCGDRGLGRVPRAACGCPAAWKGFADVLGFAGPLAAGYLGAVGLGVAPAAVFPGIGWIVSILLLGYSPGGDVVIPGKLGTDPGIGTVGSLYLLSGLLGTLAAGVLASHHLRRIAHAARRGHAGSAQ